jgi:hypothetical protein
MNRRAFTRALAALLSRMIEDGHEPVLFDVGRSASAQEAEYAKGRQLVDRKWVVVDPLRVVTQKDGILKRSAHQDGKAADIYFVVTRPDGSVYIDYGFKETFDLAVYYHNIWREECSGKIIIEWDLPHYEG